MITYQEKNFLSLLERFKEEHLSEARKKEEKDNERKKAFIAEHPRDSIISMQMKDYLISKKGFGN